LNYSLERLPMVGIVGETKPDYLVSYGVLNEKSDFRAHVGVLAQTVYVFPTVSAVEAIRSGRYKGKPATQPGYNGPTAWGYPVPWNEIERIVPVWAKVAIERVAFREDDSPSVKGEKAVRVVAALLSAGWFPLPVTPKIVEDHDLQISGLDISVKGDWRIQVKCDYKAGSGKYCTGNIYLQTDEINPLKRT
jgi:hypothetical protein